MLNKFKMFAGVALAILAFASCEKEETSMSVYDLPGRAIVKGTVYYSEKQEYVQETSQTSSHVENVFTPAIDKQVFLRISNASINSEQGGYTVFKTKTDANGNYEFEIPALEKAMDIQLKAESFEGSRSLIEGWFSTNSAVRPDTVRREGVFSCKWESVSVTANEIKFKDLKYGFAKRIPTENEEENIKHPITLTVRVGLADYNFNSFYNYHEPCFKKKSGITVRIFEGDKEIENKQTDSNGEVKFVIAPTDDDFYRRIQIKTESVISSFTYWNEEESQIINGSFKQWKYNSWGTNGEDNLRYVNIEFDEDKTESVAMVFKPSGSVPNKSYYEEWRSAYEMWVGYDNFK